MQIRMMNIYFLFRTPSLFGTGEDCGKARSVSNHFLFMLQAEEEMVRYRA